MSASSAEEEAYTKPSTSPGRGGSSDSSPGEDGEISDHGASPSKSGNRGETREGDDPPLPDEDAPPLPNEDAPALPDEAPPDKSADDDDGWEPVWDGQAQAFYFYNRFTKMSQWDNPRVPEIQQTGPPGVPGGPPGVGNYDRLAGAPPADATTTPAKIAGGYDPAIHGDYDPDADYAKVHETPTETSVAPTDHPADAYAATGTFNRFTGKWQRAELNPDNFTDEQKSRRQMNAFFDVDAAANTHDGRSLRAERAGKKLTKAELKAFKEKRREKKEEKRRAWLRD